MTVASPSSSSPNNGSAIIPSPLSPYPTSEQIAPLVFYGPEQSQLGTTPQQERVVRFNNECVLIPDSTAGQPKSPRLPMMVTKSYSLPLWTRRKASNSNGNAAMENDVDGPAAAPGVGSDAVGLGKGEERLRVARSPSPGEERVVIKVPIPLFRRRSSRSPTRSPTSYNDHLTHRGRSLSTSPVIPKKLPSCLVHRDSSSPTSPTASSLPFSVSSSSNTSLTLSLTTPSLLHPVRRPSLPIYHRRKEDVTVPLRACCAACQRTMEESLREGENWKEKFTKGARRRRSASLDRVDQLPHGSVPLYENGGSGHRRSSSMSKTTKNTVEGINGLSIYKPVPSLPSDSGTASDLELSASPFEMSSLAAKTAKFALAVDEVDKLRKSSQSVFGSSLIKDDSMILEGLEPFEAATPPGLSSSPPSSDSGPWIGLGVSGHKHARLPGSTISSSSKFIKPLSSSTPSSTSTLSVPSSPGLQELLIPQDILSDSRCFLRSSPIQEETEDEAQLFPLPSPRRSPSGSPRASPGTSPRASPIPPSPNGSTSQLLTVPTNVGVSKDSSQESLLKTSLSRRVVSSPSPAPSGSTTSGGSKVFERTETGERPILPKGPRNRSVSASTTGGSSQPTEFVTQKSLTPLRLTTAPIPIPTSSSHSHHLNPSSSPISASASTTSSPSTPHAYGKRKHSFTLPFIKAGEVLRGASVDVLKGVSSIGSGVGGSTV